VKLSAKTEYACLAVLELARRYDSGEPVRIRDIAAEHGVPARFLVQILIQLKGAGLVSSTRGASGGYQLAKSPDEILLGEVMSAVDGQENLPTVASGSSPAARVLLRTWREIDEQQQELLNNINFAELAAQTRGAVEEMYFI
jgi:Rrf2 family protein